MSTRYCVSFLLLIQASLLLYLNWETSANRTEGGHLGAAAYFWKTGRFDVFCVNPPLTRMFSGLAVVIRSPERSWTSYSPRPQDRSEWSLGSNLIDANDEEEIRLLFFLARSFLIPLILLGGYFGYRYSTELYGNASGYIFLVLWTFSPLFLGWGATICPDMVAASLGIVGVYAYWRWLRVPNGNNLLYAGIGLGLAPLAKMTWILAFPLYLVFWIIKRLTCRKEESCKNPSFRGLLCILFIGLYVINMGYLFDGTFYKLGDYKFISCTLSGQKEFKSGNRFTSTWLGKLPIPLPKDFVQGIDTQKHDFEQGMNSYLNGKTSERGWKSYYLFVLLYKEPVPSLILLALAVFVTPINAIGSRCSMSQKGLENDEILIKQESRESQANKEKQKTQFNQQNLTSNKTVTSVFDETILILTALTLFIFISLQDGISIHPRYVLPFMPFMYIFASRTGLFFQKKCVAGSVIVTVLLLGFILGSLLQYPHSMSYFNAIAGGPENGPKHLLGSNADWGQSLYYFKKYCHKHPNRDICVTFLRKEQLERLKIENARPFEKNTDSPTTELPSGWYVLSVNDVYGQSEQELFNTFRHQKPTDRIGASIFIYYLEHQYN